MSAPRPQQLRTRVADVRALVTVIATEYEWVYRAAYDRVVREEAKVATGAPTDPTGELATSRGAMRAALRRADRDLRGVSDQLREIERRLAGALERLEPRERPEARFPRTASDADLAEARAAQGRRTDRGSGFGEG